MKIVQYIRNPIPPEYGACLDNIKAGCPADVEYELITTQPFAVDEDLEDYRYQSDLVRFRLAAENADMVWVDADCEFGTKGFFRPDPNTRLPYFWATRHRIPDICCFYVNGCSWFFKKLLDVYERMPKPIKTGWPQKIVADNCGSWLPIPVGHYNHFGLHGKIKKQ